MDSPLSSTKRPESQWRLTNSIDEKEKGNRAFKDGDYSEAIICYSKSLDLDPNSPAVFGNRAQAYLNMGKPNEAEVDCCSAITLDPKFVKGYFRRGVARKMLKKYQLALADFEKALELDPKNIQCKNEIKLVREQLLLEKNSEKNVKETSGKRSRMEYFPTQIPSNPFLFYQDWRELGEDEQSKLKYLKMIGGSTLGTIFEASILEPNIWIEIINILEREDDFKFQLEILHGLCRTRNSSSLLLFLEKDERTKVSTMVGRMKEKQDLDQETVESVIKALKIE